MIVVMDVPDFLNDYFLAFYSTRKVCVCCYSVADFQRILYVESSTENALDMKLES
jgi:hypothetical protein